MIKIRSTYDEQYLKTSMNKEKIYFSEITDEPTKHKVVSDIASVCHPDILPSLKGKIIPIFSIDLKEINPLYDAKIPILYNENARFEWIVSELNEEGKITDCYHLGYEKDKVRFDTLTFEDEIFFEDGEEDELMNIAECGNYLKIWHETPIEAIVDLKKTDDSLRRISDWQHDTWVSLSKNRGDEANEFEYWGPYINQVQANFDIPYDEETKEDFIFIGQISAGSLDLCSFYYFIFYNPNKNIVAQYMQMT